MNERIKTLRKTLKLTLAEFGDRIGVTKSAMSKIENGANGTTEQTIKSICREFGVREEWLREGTGEIFQKQEETFSLDQFVKEHGGTDLELRILQTYFSLDPSVRRAIMEYFQKSFGQVLTEKKSPSTEQLEEEYKKNGNRSISICRYKGLCSSFLI